MRENLQHYLIILVVAVLIFFIHLGAPKLWDRDEPRNAGCAVEMLDRGDWVVPMFNNELRIHKPVLLYWFIMSAYGMFGVGEFGARFWSAMFGLGTLFTTYQIGRRLFSAKTGLWAAVILASCMMFPVASRAATPDAVLIFFATLAMAVYVHGAFPLQNGKESSQKNLTTAYFSTSWPLVALMYAVMGVAILAKGPVGLVLPMAIIGLFLLIIRLPQPDDSAAPPEDPFVGWLGWLLRPFAPRHFLAVLWSMRPITAIVVALAVATPWYVWVGVRTDGEWLKGFFWVHHFQRMTESMESHGGPFYYYFVAILISFFPWSLLIIPTIEQVVGKIRQKANVRPQYIFVACWAALYIVAFSFARTKLPSYVSPSLPAFALLTACFVEQWASQGAKASQYWFRFAFNGLLVTGIGVGIGVFVASFWFLPGDGWLGILGLIPLAGGVIGWRYLRQLENPKAAVTFAATAVLFACTLFSFVTVQISRHQRSGDLFAAMNARAANPKLAAFRCLEPSWVFYSHRPIEVLNEADSKSVQQYLNNNNEAFVITTDKQWEELKPGLADDIAIVAEVPYFTRPNRLLLLGHEQTPGNATKPMTDGERLEEK